MIDELELRRHGYKVFVADPRIWCPFDDGTSSPSSSTTTAPSADMRDNGFSDADIKGQFAYEDIFDRLRKALREGTRDTWIGDSPDRAELEELLGHDPELIDVLFETSIADVIDRLHHRRASAAGALRPGRDRRLGRAADPGTASIKLMHFPGTLEDTPWRGATSRAAWAGSRSRSPRPRRRPARCSPPASPSPRSSPATASCSRAAR